MNPRWALLLALFWLAGSHADALELTPRTVSGSRQFIVFSPDAALRNRAASLADDLKASILEILGDTGSWRIPVVISLKPAETAAAESVAFRLFETAGGSSIQISIQIGENPADAHFQELIARAVLLEYSLRNRPAIKGGEAYVEAPWWLTAAMVQMFATRGLEVETGLYRSVVGSEKVPEIKEFLMTNNAGLGSTARAVDASYAVCLVRLLIEQPNGRANLARLVRNWPDSQGDPVGALTKEFPGLAASPTALQKWWTVNLARLSVLDRYKGLSSEATEKELSALLRFDLVLNKAGDKRAFDLGKFEEFTKLPAFKSTMARVQSAMVRLSLQTNALYRPIIADYEQIFSSLARGKFKGVVEQIDEVTRYRAAVTNRMSAIADYLNWYEATQVNTRSAAFDGFLKAASELMVQEDKSRSNGAVKNYLDQLEREF
ncbi:MAG: hypothetical protein JWL59_3052 [Chthoniobacteraceae bacterium]|nr:hypothetical protein [Chthoniobacteraceae bacterium]